MTRHWIITILYLANILIGIANVLVDQESRQLWVTYTLVWAVCLFVEVYDKKKAT